MNCLTQILEREILDVLEELTPFQRSLIILKEESSIKEVLQTMSSISPLKSMKNSSPPGKLKKEMKSSLLKMRKNVEEEMTQNPPQKTGISQSLMIPTPPINFNQPKFIPFIPMIIENMGKQYITFIEYQKK